MKSPRRPALRYHGSKWLLAPWIAGHFPAHECYVEPFGGAAGVLLRKPRSWLEVYNDKDCQVVNFFRVLREHEDELIRAIELTPYSLVEWELSMHDDPDPLEAARRFYVRSFQGIAGPTAQWRTGWRRQKMVTKENGKKRMTPAPISFMRVGYLHQVAERLRGVQIECGEALDVMRRYDARSTLHYLDPPYVASTRNRWKKQAYAHEMTDAQHAELARAAHEAKGMVIVSGYRCELYDELYAGWLRVDREARTNSAGTATESLWISPDAASARLPLFALADTRSG